MKKRFGAPSPALVISIIALFVALGGTSYAALALPKNSVGTKQLKNNAVTGAKLANGATLAHGHTETGTFGFGASGAAVVLGDISYPIPLAADPQVVIVGHGGPIPTGCKGNLSNPGAESGYLCVFEGYSEGGVSLVNDYFSVTNGSQVGLTRGVMLYATGGGSGNDDISGTWAATG